MNKRKKQESIKELIKELAFKTHTKHLPKHTHIFLLLLASSFVYILSTGGIKNDVK